MSDLFDESQKSTSKGYTANEIEVLEGLEPVRRRPGMYIGGTDERALHHLVAEVLDNAMDEAVAGHASRIDIELSENQIVTITDNGRGIPVDPHPKFPDLSALEVILTTLHAGGKFTDKAYQTAGGLHGVGISVVNALSDSLIVEVAREKKVWRQTYSQGVPTSALEQVGQAPNRRGTKVSFHPDPAIFKDGVAFKPSLLHKLARSKAYLFRGVEIRWQCAAALLEGQEAIPAEAVFHFPNGLGDYVDDATKGEERIIAPLFAGQCDLPDGKSRAEWAIAWLDQADGWTGYYCNTIPTPLGGTHEMGLRQALLRGLRHYGELAQNKRANQITAEDIFSQAVIVLSVFIPDPQFQGQTKEKLTSPDATRLVEQGLRDRFDLWLGEQGEQTRILLDALIERAEERIARRKQKELSRKSATRKLRLPGKLADCARQTQEGTELFIVEGDSAGGSAKQARDRNFQAILPLRGKIINVASASSDKQRANREISDLITALGCGYGKHLNLADLRYERIIIMTDADVDGAHIASLLMTFFYQEMSELIEQGHLYLARPPLYRITAGGRTLYAHDEAERDRIINEDFKGRKTDTGRFKGLGEMNARQLKDTTMHPGARQLLQVQLTDAGEAATKSRVNALMGRKPELRLAFIQENAHLVDELDV